MSRPDPIATSGLPSEIQDLLHQVIGRTRLWERERLALTLELLAHFHDGLEAGRTPADLINTFGDPKLAATLMRRAKKRNRPLWWKLLRGSLQTLSVFILIYLGAMVFLLTGRPELKVDYAAQLCAAADAVPQSDRAWPIYRDAWLKDPPAMIQFTPKPPPNPKVLEPQRRAYFSLADNRPDDPYWDQAVALVQQHPGLLEAAHAAALKPGLGITLQERRNPQSDYRKVFPLQPSSHALLSMMDSTLDCRENGGIYTTISLLLIDIRLAATQNDAARIVHDYRTIASLYRQMSETRTLISELLRLIAAARTDTALADIIANRPDLLSAQQQIELLHILSSTRDAIAVSFESQRLDWQDLVQRIYTDDGNGDGRLTQEGAECFIMQGPGKRPHVTSALTLPLLSACVASRRDITQLANEHYDLLNRGLQRPLPELLVDAQANDTELNRRIMEISQSMAARIHYWPLSVVIPQFLNVGKDVHLARAQHDALIVALALEAYRTNTGAYPRTLGQLVPHYLAAIPADPLHYQPLHYALHDGKPILYTPGRDGTDRGGTPTNTPPATIPDSADWILFPPASP